MLEERGVVRVGDGEGVVAENFGRVMFGVEADAEQVCVGGELFVNLGEVGAYARAEIGERAARVDESDEQKLPAILVERDFLAALVGEGKIRDFVSG